MAAPASAVARMSGRARSRPRRSRRHCRRRDRARAVRRVRASRGRRRSSPCGRSPCAAARPGCRREVRTALAPELGRSLLAIDGGARLAGSLRAPGRGLGPFRPVVPAHAARQRSGPSAAVLLVRQGKDELGRLGARPGDAEARHPRPARCRGCGSQRAWRERRREAAAATAQLAQLRSLRVAPDVFAGRRARSSRPGRALTLVLGSGTADAARRWSATCRLKLTIAARILRIGRRKRTPHGAYVDVSVPERPVLGIPNSPNRR